MAVSMDNAFEGFRLGRHKPLTIAIWAAYFLIASAITAALTVSLMGPAMQQFMAASQAGPQDPEAALQSLAAIWPASMLISLWSVAVYSIGQTAATRAVLRPQDDRFGYLRFGADELRVFLSLLGYWGVLLGVYFAGVVAAVVLSVVGMLAGPVVGGLLIAAAIVAIMVAMVYVGVRLSLAPAMTVESRKIRVMASWEQTRGQVLPMLGAYFVSWIMAVLVMLLMTVIYIAIAAVVTGDVTRAMAALSDPQAMSSLQAYFSPLRLIYLPVGALMQAMMAGITATVPAAILAQMRGPRASVFD